MTSVKWVTGRRKALARAMALEITQASGDRWDHLGKKEQASAIAAANAVISSWIANGVCLEYDSEFAEAAPAETVSRHDPTVRKCDTG